MEADTINIKVVTRANNLFFIILNLCDRGLTNQSTHFIINSRNIIANNDLKLTALTNRTFYAGNRFDLFCICYLHQSG